MRGPSHGRCPPPAHSYRERMSVHDPHEPHHPVPTPPSQATQTTPQRQALPHTTAALPVQPQPPTQPAGSQPPTLTNGATVHGRWGIPALRHPAELALMWTGAAVSLLAFLLWIAVCVWLVMVPDPPEHLAGVRDFFVGGGSYGTQFLLVMPLLPAIVWVLRALLYAQMRSTSVQMSPTQFPEGYRMVVEAAEQFGMRRVPDAYVMLGNGDLNAFASGHGFRRFIVVNSDVFEVGGRARDPEALRFVIGHEGGHLAAGHVSWFRMVATALTLYIPILGPALTRAQEYTADNHGYAVAPQGAAGAVGLLTGGKYLGAQVNMHAMADRAAREKGFWLHVTVWRASHPVPTWRAHALRDRRAPGRIMIRPKETTAWFPPSSLTGSSRSLTWPTPAQTLAVLNSSGPRSGEEQFGRYPGVEYTTPRDDLRLADPTAVPRTAGAQPVPPAQQPPQQP